MLESSFLLFFSIVVLYFGAEFSLNASEKVGAKLGLSPLLVGMLLIGFGTSLPEMFVAHIAGSQGKVGIAIGSLIGSNIANMFFILGAAGLVAKLSVFSQGIKKHLAVHLILSVVLGLVLTRSKLDLVTTLPLLSVCALYLFIIKRDLEAGRESSKDVDPELKKGKSGVLFLQMITGFGMLYIGGEYLVISGTDLCLQLGISEYIVSAIFIALGTSFPEFVTAMMAAIKKKDTDLIIGNIVGSNIFNCGFILGSLGIYDFVIDTDFKIETISLVSGALLLLLYSSKEKYFYRKTSILFLLAYVFVVLTWVKFL